MDENKNREQAIFTDKLVAETRWLLALTEPDRTQYVRDIINGLSQSISKITTHQGGLTQKLELINAFIQELDTKAHVLIPPITYAVKPEYQEVFKSFMKRLIPN